MAGLPATRAMVWVGPPLSCSPFGSRPGSATPTILPLVPPIKPPEPPVPIRLYALVEDTVPAMSLADAVVPLPMVFIATIVLSSVAVPRVQPDPLRRRLKTMLSGDGRVGDGQSAARVVDAAADRQAALSATVELVSVNA